ncbi:MAG: mersacidin/lichenicidin family type 2 lantibiotic [Aphanothece sp. CMT-3BRIN-NPC111]|jgi:mersacidin/lichenicidin family type 2 lantibiotic|nr:mersacidin/lichenicidin family type 2 lantibiotic [Aphanothece sp. CMT-3BRIN-NPC111]
MSHENIIRAWKDAEFRNSLSAEELASLPENPAGVIELTDAEMKSVTGAAPPYTSPAACQGTTNYYCTSFVCDPNHTTDLLCDYTSAPGC